MTTYVLHDTEVKLTGRTASKKGVGTKVSELVEVTPSDEDNGTWKKWVPMNTLFQIAKPETKAEPFRDDRIGG